jgi:hypothetical protein
MFNHLPGVERFQVVQTGSDRLKVRLQVRAAFESAQVWETALGHLQELLAAEGVGPVHLERSPEPPLTDPLTGKYRYVAIDMAASEQHTPDLSLQPGSAPG